MTTATVRTDINLTGLPSEEKMRHRAALVAERLATYQVNGKPWYDVKVDEEVYGDAGSTLGRRLRIVVTATDYIGGYFLSWSIPLDQDDLIRQRRRASFYGDRWDYKGKSRRLTQSDALSLAHRY